jgi:nucleotide-binding universal stress UspA family protein
VRSKIVGRVIVGVDGSPGSLEALRFALGQARLLGATLMPVLAWRIPGGELAARRAPSASYAQLVREMAESQLLQAFDEGLGGMPEDVPTEALLIRGEAGPALVQAADRRSDQLVIGAGRRGTLRHAIHGSTARYCLAHAVCPVIAVPPPQLQAEIPAQWRRRQTIDDLLDDLSVIGEGR